jgi:hypothetical protein
LFAIPNCSEDVGKAKRVGRYIDICIKPTHALMRHAVVALDHVVDARSTKRLTLAEFGGNGNAQNTLDGHRVGAKAIITEGMATAVPLPVVERDGVGVIIATYGDGEILELDARRIFSIEFGFSDFADQTRRH